MTTITNLEKLQKLIANFPPHSTDARYQKELFDEILNVLNNLNKEVAEATTEEIAEETTEEAVEEETGMFG